MFGDYYEIPVPGTNVTAHLGEGSRPGRWHYALWADEQEDGTLGTLVSRGDLKLDGLNIAPEQVAQIAFLLDAE